MQAALVQATLLGPRRTRANRLRVGGMASGLAVQQTTQAQVM